MCKRNNFYSHYIYIKREKKLFSNLHEYIRDIMYRTSIIRIKKYLVRKKCIMLYISDREWNEEEWSSIIM